MPPVNAAIKRHRQDVTQPCVCCGCARHDSIPDADLEGYVCRPCKRHLRVVEEVLKANGISGCVPEPK